MSAIELSSDKSASIYHVQEKVATRQKLLVFSKICIATGSSILLITLFAVGVLSRNEHLVSPSLTSIVQLSATASHSLGLLLVLGGLGVYFWNRHQKRIAETHLTPKDFIEAIKETSFDFEKGRLLMQAITKEHFLLLVDFLGKQQELNEHVVRVLATAPEHLLIDALPFGSTLFWKQLIENLSQAEANCLNFFALLDDKIEQLGKAKQGVMTVPLFDHLAIVATTAKRFATERKIYSQFR